MSLWEINRRLSGDVVLGGLAFQTKVEIRIAQPLAVSPGVIGFTFCTLRL